MIRNVHVPPQKAYLSVQVKKEVEPLFDKDSLDAFLSQGNRVLNTPRQKVLQSRVSNTTPVPVFRTPLVRKTTDLSTPKSSPFTPSQDLTSQFLSRKIQEGPLEIFNAHVPDAVGDMASLTKRVKVSLVPGQQVTGYRYMHDKLADEGMVIDESIDAVAELIAAQESLQTSQAQMDVDEEEVTPDTLLDDEKDPIQLIQRFMPPPNIPRQEQILTVGRICCDSVTDASKLNDRSVLLETSRLIGNGIRIPLNLEALITGGTPYSLFPGQIVGVRGRNPSGRLFNVEAFVAPPLPPPATTDVSRLASLYPPNDPKSKEPLQFMVAAGPFTLPDSLEYEPFASLIDKAESQKPDVLILLGPFVEGSHPLIMEGMSPHDPKTLFKIKIMNRIQKLLSSQPGLQVLLIPSTLDLITDWPLLPQPPLGVEMTESDSAASALALGLNLERLLVLPNPVTFFMNETLVSISNTDSLLELAGSETGRVQKGVPSDRLSLFFKHVLQQRHLHPLSPSTHKIQYEHLAPFMLGIQPDLLIMPSSLKQSIKAVEGVLCVNPGKCVKGKVAGSFARLVVHPLEVQGLLDAQEEDVVAGLVERTRAELLKL